MDGKESIVNVATVRHLSPFRYPGGKTWLVPHVIRWVKAQAHRCTRFVEPFAGGGIVSLSILAEGLADRVVLVEKDKAVASVWQTMLGRDASWLIKEILDFDLTRERVVERLAIPPASRRELAFQTILRNRVQRGGILAPGASLMLKGEAGKGIASRWYPETLADRIRAIREISGRITFVCGEAFKSATPYLSDPTVLWFVDPPYTAGGKSAGSRLYAHNQVDHAELFHLFGSAMGASMLTYDDAAEVKELAALHGYVCDHVPMKNTHHNVLFELVMTKPAVSAPQRTRARQRVVAAIMPELARVAS